MFCVVSYTACTSPTHQSWEQNVFGVGDEEAHLSS